MNLPDELLCNIFALVTDVIDQRACRVVCHRMRRLVDQHIVSSICADEFYAARRLSLLSRRFPNISQLHCKMEGGVFTDLSALSSLSALKQLGCKWETAGYNGLGRLLHPSISMLTALTRLSIRHAEGDDIASNVGHLTGLQYLDMDYCACPQSSLSALTALTALTHLSLDALSGRPGRSNNDLLPATLAHLTGLKHLSTHNITQLTSLQPVTGLTALTCLRASYNHRIGANNDLSCLEHLLLLEHLDLSSCSAVTSLQAITALTALARLDIRYNDNIMNLPQLPGLRELDMTGTVLGLGSLTNVGGVTKLHTGELGFYTHDEYDTIWRSFPALASLCVCDEDTLTQTHMRSLPSACPGLRELMVQDCDSCHHIPRLASRFSGLRSLNIRYKGSKHSLKPLSGLSHVLEDLTINNNNGAHRIQLGQLASLSRLTQLTLETAGGNKTLTPLKALVGLRSLTIRTAGEEPATEKEATSLTALKQMTNLTFLCLGCAIKCIRPLLDMPRQFHTLELRDRAVSDLVIADCHTLYRLDVPRRVRVID